MSEVTAQTTGVQPAGRPPGTARKRRRPRWGKRLAWLAGAVVLLGVAGVFSVRIGVERYLRSGAFAAQLNATAGRAMAAECRLEDVSWQGSTGYAGTFVAEGREEAAFRRLSVAEVRAELDTGAFWDRVWRVPQIKIAQVTADFSSDDRVAAAAPDLSPPSPAPSAAGGGWWQRWLPNRTELGPVQVERVDFVRKPSAATPGWEGSGFSLVLKPNMKSQTCEVDARSGTLRLTGVKRTVQVDRVRTTVRRDAAALDQFSAHIEDAILSAEGTISFLIPGELRLNIGLSEANLARWLPEDWLRRCQGVAAGSARVRGDWRHPDSLKLEGDFKIINGTLQALPLLDIVAKKTQNASFLRMQIKEATGRFERRRVDQWELRQLRADAPGLLRLKGSVDIGAGGTLRGPLLLGIVPGTLRYLTGAEQTVFLSADQFTARTGNVGVLSADDAALLWTRLQLGGTVDAPSEDLSERLARAWFNATVDEVASLSMEAAASVTRTAAGAAGKALEAAPPLLEKAPELLNQGVQGGLKILDGLLPR